VVFRSGHDIVTEVTVRPRRKEKVEVTITADPLLADRSQYGGYLVFTPVGGGTKYSVPYAGFKGDYQSIQVLVPTPSGYPWLAKFDGTNYSNQTAGATYTMEDGDIPYILVHFEHHARQMRLDVFEAHTGRAWHGAFRQDYLPRGATSTSFSAYGWDGHTLHGNRVRTVPNGQYVLKLSVLKALGNDRNPAHTEVWTSPVITIARP
jgi:minor extracellular serine protease Vpr